jgi:hypothetical protein
MILNFSERTVVTRTGRRLVTPQWPLPGVRRQQQSLRPKGWDMPWYQALDPLDMSTSKGMHP